MAPGMSNRNRAVLPSHHTDSMHDDREDHHEHDEADDPVDDVQGDVCDHGGNR